MNAFRILFLSLWTLGFAQSEVTNATDFERLKADLAAIAPILKKETVEYEDVAKMEESLSIQINNIYLDINTRLPEGLGNTNPEWQGYIERLGASMKPYESEMIEAAFRSASEDLPQGWQLKRIGDPLLSLLDFATPDPILDQRLRRALEQFPAAKWEIYRKIYEHRLLKREDIDSMVAEGAAIVDPDEKIRWAEEVSFYGSDEGLEILKEILSVPFDSKGLINERGEPESNEMLQSYLPVARSIAHLGVKANSLLPLIEAREAEVRSSIKSLFGENVIAQGTVIFRGMRLYINGKKRPIPSARNGSGLIYLPGEVSQPANTGEKIRLDPPLIDSGALTKGEESTDKIKLDDPSNYKPDTGKHALYFLALLALGTIAVLNLRQYKKQ